MNKLKSLLAHPTTRTLGIMFLTGNCVLFGFAFILEILSYVSR